MDLGLLEHRLIVCCQPAAGGPTDRSETVAALARAVLAGGASGVRIEGAGRVAAVRAATDAPIIGLVARDIDGSPVRITPWLADVVALAVAGADVIAFDATARPRPTPVSELVTAVHATGRLAMADCATAAEAAAALAAGADFVATTMSGSAGDAPPPAGPDLELVAALRRLTPRVIAAGRIRSPEEAAEALRRGAWAVVVGSDITGAEHGADVFAQALAAARADAEERRR